MEKVTKSPRKNSNKSQSIESYLIEPNSKQRKFSCYVNNCPNLRPRLLPTSRMLKDDVSDLLFNNNIVIINQFFIQYCNM